MPDDDFLSQFREAPPPDFARNLYQKLQEQETMTAVIQPVRVLPASRRFLTIWAAALIITVLGAGLLFASLRPDQTPTTALIPLNQEDEPTPEPAIPDFGSLDHIASVQPVMQTWNNDAAATLATVLDYYGIETTQAEIARAIRPHPEDKSVHPWQIEQYLNVDFTLGDDPIRAIARPAGSTDLLKHLIAQNFPVVIQKLYTIDTDWYGHYTFLVSYSETAFGTYDSMEGTGWYERFDPQSPYDMAAAWGAFNYQFIVFYPQSRAGELQGILGDLWDEQSAWAKAADLARLNTSIGVFDPQDWFNLGEALTHLGDYDNAAEAFMIALKDAPPDDRRLWYNPTPLEAYYQSGDFAALTTWLDGLAEVAPGMEEVNYYRALMVASEGKAEEALALLDQIPGTHYTPAMQLRRALMSGSYSGMLEIEDLGISAPVIMDSIEDKEHIAIPRDAVIYDALTAGIGSGENTVIYLGQNFDQLLDVEVGDVVTMGDENATYTYIVDEMVRFPSEASDEDFQFGMDYIHDNSAERLTLVMPHPEAGARFWLVIRATPDH